MAFIIVTELFPTCCSRGREPAQVVINTDQILQIRRLGDWIEHAPHNWPNVGEEKKTNAVLSFSNGDVFIDSSYDDFVKLLKQHDR